MINISRFSCVIIHMDPKTIKYWEEMGTRHTPGQEEQRHNPTTTGRGHQKRPWAWFPGHARGPDKMELRGLSCRGWSGDGGVKSILWHSSPISGHKPQNLGKPAISLSYSYLKGSQTSRQRLRLSRDDLWMTLRGQSLLMNCYPGTGQALALSLLKTTR